MESTLAALGDDNRSVSISMRFFCTLLLVIGFASGCNTKRVAVTSSANPNFDRALGAIEASADWDAAHYRAAPLSIDVLPAIEMTPWRANVLSPTSCPAPKTTAAGAVSQWSSAPG